MDKSNIEEVFELFAKLLGERFEKGKFTTEDSVRYTFFYCLTECMNLKPSDIILEYSHPSIERAKIDLRIEASNAVPEMFFEFKYYRKDSQNDNSPRTQKAGKVFADIFRLASIEPNSEVKRYLIFVTDEEMAKYLLNNKNGLIDFFNLKPADDPLPIDIDRVKCRCKTFIKSAGNNINPSNIACKLDKKTKGNKWIKIYEILPNKTGQKLP